jgi:hypothetical protein
MEHMSMVLVLVLVLVLVQSEAATREIKAGNNTPLLLSVKATTVLLSMGAVLSHDTPRAIYTHPTCKVQPAALHCSLSLATWATLRH